MTASELRRRGREAILASSGSCRTLGRDLNAGSVDVIGAQLEEVTE